MFAPWKPRNMIYESVIAIRELLNRRVGFEEPQEPSEETAACSLYVISLLMLGEEE